MRALAAVAVLCFILLPGREAAAEGRVLDGRKAPDLVFSDGVGIAPGTALSSYRGRVVWIKFVLRDCARCREEYPRVQDLHERWGGMGLVVIVVMHEHPPADFRPLLESHGYTFRVGCDPRGELARAYGVGRRPTDYVIGTDGRVRASNRASDEVLRTELARRRVERLGEVPETLAGVRDLVWAWNYGAALRAAEPRAAADDAPEGERRFVERLREQAAEELEARLEYAAVLAAREERATLDRFLDLLVAHFEGTSLEKRARAERRRMTER